MDLSRSEHIAGLGMHGLRRIQPGERTGAGASVGGATPIGQPATAMMITYRRGSG